MNIIEELQKPEYVARFQRFCGVIPVSEVDEKEGCDGVLQNGCVGQKNVGSIQENGSIRHRRDHNSVTGDNDECVDVVRNKSENGGPVMMSSKLDNSEQEESVCNGIAHKENTERIRKSSHAEVKYIIRYKPIHYLFRLASILGDEPFYLLFCPIFGWNADFYMTRLAALVWAAAMYLGQATKDVVKWPRPSYPPVISLETQYLQEYGMPSTHAMAGTVLPFTLLYLVTTRYEVPFAVGLCVAVAWCGLVCVSRLYLGVHTVGDIVMGALYAFLIMLIAIPWLSAFDHFQQTNPLAPIILMVVAILLCTKLYPKGEKSAIDVAATIVSVVYGFCVGTWLNYNLGIFSMNDDVVLPLKVSYPTWQWAWHSLLRLLIGPVVLIISKIVLKAITVPLATRLVHIWQAEPTQHAIMTIYRFTTYSILGMLISYGIPRLFYFMSIDRPGFYTEGI